MQAQTISKETIEQHGLTDEEYQKVLNILGREPNLVELGIFSVMWSEHCSYKSTRLHLKNLPTEAPWVICGPGENAGVIDIGDGQAAIFKMESHNHPSFIEPYQGAATGVGGIMRDVFTMGARPIANMNALRFGELDHPKTPHLLSGVVAGIGGYGNCMGIPTVGGECNFHASYNGNILVNAMCVGLADQDKIFYSAASDIGSPIVYVGAKTGRDGIHGATMASAEFDDESHEKRPTVQVGDPFTEKRLMEACLELMATDAILSIQDMGAAGLTCSSLEMADKGGTGVELVLDDVPVREAHMTPYEMMLSESQERMLMVIKPEKEAEARAVFKKWEIDFAIIGKITDTGRMVLKFEGETVADMPVAPLSQEAPIYDRPHEVKPNHQMVDINQLNAPEDLPKTLLTMLATPDLTSKRWIWEQYDNQVMNDTMQGPGGDAAVVRVHNTQKALAITTDCTPRYCFADPVTGGKQAVTEAWRNLICVGAKPLAITNCLNFANPEKKEIMGQLVGALQGMTAACETLSFPVISGNVSLYNETNGEGIYPTPAIGGVGLIADHDNVTGNKFTPDQAVFLLGETEGHMGASLYLREIEQKEDGAPPPVFLDKEKQYGEFILSQNLTACHDISDGGLYVALAEMAMAGNTGAELTIDSGALPLFVTLFCEDQGRYIVTVKDKDAFAAAAESAGIKAYYLGKTGGDTLTVNGQSVTVKALKEAHESTLPNRMAL